MPLLIITSLTIELLPRFQYSKDAVEIKPTNVKHDIKPRPEEFFDDYDLAEHEIFDRVENAEKTVLTATGNLIRDPVNFLFSNHKDNSDKMMGEEINQFSGRRGSHLFHKDKKKTSTVSAKKESVVVVESEDKHMGFKQLIEELKSRLTLNRKG